jgi:eukaryotic-like serine/threonine-protein kinase
MRFLIIDDDPPYRRILRYHLEVAWPDASIVEYVPGPGDDLPQTGGVDLILLGHPLEGEKGLQWLQRLTEREECPPVMVFAARSDAFLAVDALKAGAANFFPKQGLRHRRLVSAIRAETGVRDPGETAKLLVRHNAYQRDGTRRLLGTLYSGDLSSVYLAQDDDASEPVAFKVIKHVSDAAGERLLDRFLQEYEIIARVRHPNVVRIFDLGIADDHAYIAMEYLAGGSLAQRLNGPMAEDMAVDYVRQIASALMAIHEAGVLHRDLKPANIMFRRDGSLVLIDFGLAKQMRLQAAITLTGQIFGTPYYMSPEQGHSEPTDERSDIYSLGCIFYQLLTGRRPFKAGTAMGIIYRHAHAPRPRLPERLRRVQPILDRMLAVEPAERYQSAEELLRALDDLGQPPSASAAKSSA